MKISQTNSPLLAEGWDQDTLFVLEELAVAAQKELNLLTEDQMMEMPAQHLTVIKKTVKDTFTFILKGNVFVFVDERKLTRRAIQKLEDFYNRLGEILSMINMDAVHALLNLIASYILYAIAFGSIVVSQSSAKTAEWMAEFFDQRPRWLKERVPNGQKEVDPFIYMIIILASINSIAAAKLADVTGTTANEQRAKADTYRRERPPMYTENFNGVINMAKAFVAGKVMNAAGKTINDEINKFKKEPDYEDTFANEVSNEMIKRFVRLAKRNPKKAAKVMRDLYNAAPEDYQEAFWDGMKAGVKKSFVRKVKSFLLSLGSNLLNR